MTERRQLLRRNGRAAARSRRPAAAGGVRPSDTMPTAVPPVLPTQDEQTILGFPADSPDPGTGL